MCVCALVGKCGCVHAWVHVGVCVCVCVCARVLSNVPIYASMLALKCKQESVPL